MAHDAYHDLFAVETHNAEQRRRLAGDFADKPEDDDLWQTAYEWVRQEGDAIIAGDTDTAAADIPAGELIGLAQRVRETPLDGRYALMTETASNGELWFDVVRTFHSEQLERAKQHVLRDSVLPPARYYARALDVGTGTGRSLPFLEANADQVTGLDRDPALLGAAARRKAGHTALVRASAEAMPFADDSFDLITNSGMEAALDDKQLLAYYSEIKRVLRPGAIHISASWLDNEAGYPGREAADIYRTSKALLADMIVDTVTGNLLKGPAIDWNERTRLVGRAGLSLTGFIVADRQANDGTESAVVILSKPRS